MVNKCPNCGNDLVTPFGRSDSPILIIGEYPGTMELRMRSPWVGEAGDILRSELSRAGINYSDCRATNLWLHEKRKKNDDMYPGCWDFMMQQLISHLSKSEAILICGSDTVEFLTQKKVMTVNGLRVTSRLIPSSAVAVACVNPAIVTKPSGVVGDLRFAISSFAELTKHIRKEYYDRRYVGPVASSRK